MKNILEAPFVKELCKITSNVYRQGWDERNGGNVSVLLDEEQVKRISRYGQRFCALFLRDSMQKELVGRYFIVTGTGKYFKNVEGDPETNLGIIRIGADGKTAELLWGYKDGGKISRANFLHTL
ncbi:MAG: class II aldolase/adducin family protein [Clostridiales bacterium]|nr:MAG: class II aldolase/adducin family protein [Clostridiales bacterium]